MEVMNAENLGESRESVGYKGPSGTGKTHNLLSWPGPLKIAYFDAHSKTARELIKSGADADVFTFDTIKEFEDEFVRKVRYREFEATTIGVDTFDFMAAMVQREVQGSKPRMTQPDWGTFLNKLRSIALDLTKTALHIDGKPSYNIVFNYHLADVTDDGNLVRTGPKIQGAFKDELEAYLDTVLYCESKVSSKPVPQPGGGSKLVPSKEFLCHSVPPNPYITCKGGGLPPVLPGDYSSLMKEWGKSKGE